MDGRGFIRAGLVAGTAVVVERLIDSHRGARRAAASYRLVADLARRAVEEVHADAALADEAMRVLVEALDADSARLLPAGKLAVTRRGRRFAQHERSVVESVAGVLAVANRRMVAERERRDRLGRDELTGLAGREGFAELLADALAPGAGGDCVTVIVLDIDDFVVMNETLGHAAGDALLRGVADRLREVVGGDASLGRLGGDEFAVLEHGPCRQLQAVELARRVQKALRTPFEIEGARQHVSASLGIAICERGGDPRGAIRDAHLAQRRAREQGRGRYELFDSRLRHGLAQRRSLEQDLRRALEQREFRLVYQPLIEIATGRIRGAEALLRWRHPERGEVGPLEFMEVAEASDLIVPIGSWALRQALRQLKAWDDNLPDADDFQLGVNVSGRQLADGRFIPLLRGQLEKYRLDPRRVTCELTETALADESPQVERAVGELKKLGVHLALDDFGTGYASLRYVRRFAFDSLKLDRSFVAGLGVSSDDTALVAAAISMGNALNMSVVAEGVESAEQAERLRSMGCELAQGFLFARPMEAGELRALVAAQRGSAGGQLPEPAAGDRDANARPGPGGAVDFQLTADRLHSLTRRR